MSFYSGNGGSVTAGTVVMNVKEWDMQKSSRNVDVTHSGSAGWAQMFPTVKEASGSVKASWDSAAMPDATVGVDVGALVTLLLKLGGSSLKFTCPAVIQTLKHQVNNQTGEVTYDFTWQSTAAVTGPA